MVAVPISKLRLADSSCSEMAIFWAPMNARLSCAEHVEIGLRHAQDQVLAPLGELGLAHGELQLGLFVGLPARPAEQRLDQLQRIGLVGVGHARQAGRGGLGAAAGERDGGHERGARLGEFFKRGGIGRPYRREGRIVGQCRLIGLLQVQCRDRRNENAGAEQRAQRLDVVRPGAHGHGTPPRT